MRDLLIDLEQILRTVPSINRVSHGKPFAISQEDAFTSVYIVPDATSYQPFKQGTAVSSYDNILYVKLYVNTLNETDPLAYTYVHSDIVKAVLDDSGLWSKVVDRDVLACTFDEYGEYPRKSFELLFELKYREPCI